MVFALVGDSTMISVCFDGSMDYSCSTFRFQLYTERTRICQLKATTSNTQLLFHEREFPV
jgi:hypothetical protein